MTINFGKRYAGGLIATDPGDTLYIPFATYNDSGASIVDTGLNQADVEIYKNNGVTARATDSGVWLGDSGVNYYVAGTRVAASALSDTGLYGNVKGLYSIGLRLFNTTDDTGFFDAGSSYAVTVQGLSIKTGQGHAEVNFIPAVFEIDGVRNIAKQAGSRGTPRANVVEVLGDTGAAHLDQGKFGVISDSGKQATVLDTGKVSSAVWNTLRADHTVAASFGKTLTDSGMLATVLDTGKVAAAVWTNHATRQVLDTGIVDTGVIAAVVWDQSLTGATHNIANSAGRRLRNLQDFGLYEGGAVWIDTVSGVAGTTDFENGTVNNPVNLLASAKTIADSVGLQVFHFLPGSSETLAASYDNYEFNGYSYSIALAAQSVSGAVFNNATITGNDDGSNATATIYNNCLMSNSVLGLHSLTHCGLSGTAAGVTLNEAGTFDWIDCHSEVAGTATPVMTFKTAVNQNLNMRNYSGGIKVNTMGAGASTDNMSLEGNGQFVEGTCTGGTVAIRGNFTVSGITNLTLSDNARIDIDQITDTVWDEADTGHQVVGTMGFRQNDTGEIVNAVWNSLRADHTTAASFGKTLTDSGMVAAVLDTGKAAAAVWTNHAARTVLDTGIAQLVWKESPSTYTADTGSMGYAQGRLMAVKGDTGAAHLDAGRLGVTATATVDTGVVVNAVWNSLRADHTVAASFGKMLADSGMVATVIDTGKASTAVWNTLRADHTVAASFGKMLADSGMVATVIDTGKASSAVWNTLRADHTVAASFGKTLTDSGMLAAVMDTGKAAASIWSNHATRVATSVTGLTAADVGTIKTATDKLVFTVANQVDANIQYVNDVAVAGTGDTGLADTWRPA